MCYHDLMKSCQIDYPMFIFSDPSNQQWCLSKDEKEISISKDVMNLLNTQDLIAIHFLYQNFKNKFKGSILNEEDKFNVQGQVSTFLSVLFSTWSKPKENFLSLVITPAYLLQEWSEKLKSIGGLKVQTVGPKTCPEDFDEEHGLALLLSFDDIKFAEALSEYNFASVVIDYFDVVATKLVIKRLTSDFNIGLTKRNFLANPDQKLQWTMLNWANPGCIGRLIDFYEADNDNFANLRDNYHHWWLTLTWNYSKSFKRNFDDTEDEIFADVKPKRKYKSRRTIKKIKTSSDENSEGNDDESNSYHEAKTRRSERIKSIEETEENQSVQDNDQTKLSESRSKFNNLNTATADKHEQIQKNNPENINISSDISEDTVEYSFDSVSQIEQEALLLNTSTDSNSSVMKFDNDDDDNILLDIIKGVQKNSSEVLDHQSQVELKKEEIYCQIFDDVPESQPKDSDSSEDFFHSLINS